MIKVCGARKVMQTRRATTEENDCEIVVVVRPPVRRAGSVQCDRAVHNTQQAGVLEGVLKTMKQAEAVKWGQLVMPAMRTGPPHPPARRESAQQQQQQQQQPSPSFQRGGKAPAQRKPDRIHYSKQPFPVDVLEHSLIHFFDYLTCVAAERVCKTWKKLVSMSPAKPLGLTKLVSKSRELHGRIDKLMLIWDDGVAKIAGKPPADAIASWRILTEALKPCHALCNSDETEQELNVYFGVNPDLWFTHALQRFKSSCLVSKYVSETLQKAEGSYAEFISENQEDRTEAVSKLADSLVSVLNETSRSPGTGEWTEKFAVDHVLYFTTVVSRQVAGYFSDGFVPLSAVCEPGGAEKIQEDLAVKISILNKWERTVVSGCIIAAETCKNRALRASLLDHRKHIRNMTFVMREVFDLTKIYLSSGVGAACSSDYSSLLVEPVLLYERELGHPNLYQPSVFAVFERLKARFVRCVSSLSEVTKQKQSLDSLVSASEMRHIRSMETHLI